MSFHFEGKRFNLRVTEHQNLFKPLIMKKVLLSSLAILLMAAGAAAQQTPTEAPKVDHTYKPVTMKLSEDGSKFLRFMFWNQTWLKYTQNNPGTLDYDGEARPTSVDIGLRRTRMLAYGQVSPRFLILMHFGINNQTFTNGGLTGATGTNRAKKPQLFFHDVYTEYQVVKNKLYIGTGLHYWNGLTRQSNASTISFFAVDAPIFNWPEIETNDQFARQMGIYAKGKLGKFDYRIAANQPFDVGASVKTLDSTKVAATEIAHHTWGSQGYFNWQFKDQESNTLGFFAGSHLGAKEVFNIGVGYYYHPEATGSWDVEAKKGVKHDVTHFAADVFYEKPLNKEKNTMLHLYGAYYQFDFGPDYLRNVGIMNTSAGITGEAGKVAYNGVGNTEPLIGTGSIIYTEAGYLMPKMGDKGQFMPYMTYTYNQFEKLDSSTDHLNVGLNYFMNGHNSKITAQYGMRSIVESNTAGELVKTGSKGELVVQFQVML